LWKAVLAAERRHKEHQQHAGTENEPDDRSCAGPIHKKANEAQQQADRSARDYGQPAKG
jgi:hypothetical protein